MENTISGEILIVEDDKDINELLATTVKRAGYDIVQAWSGTEAAMLFSMKAKEISLVLLDLMLPGLNGIEICRRIRKLSDIPIIMLTAKDEVIDKVAGLDSGADDYVTKPFAIEELLARMRVALKRVRPEPVVKNIYTCEDLVIDDDKHLVKVGENVVDLTKKDYEHL